MKTNSGQLIRYVWATGRYADGVNWMRRRCNVSYNNVLSVPIDGGAVVPFFKSGVSVEIYGAALDATYVYWTALGPERQDAEGDGAVALNDVGPSGPGSIAVDLTSVYWTVGPLPENVIGGPISHAGYVMKAPVGGCDHVQLATFETPSYPVTQLAIDDEYVYWTTADALQRTGLDGGPIETLAAHEGDPHAMVLGATDVFWACGPVDGEPAAIRKIAK